MANLLQETIVSLAEHGLSPKDVWWVGSCGGDICGTWNDFARCADREYDDDYGGTEVATDLVVVGADWWLERHEYDGREWWEFKRRPERRESPTPLLCVIRAGYGGTLKDIQ